MNSAGKSQIYRQSSIGSTTKMKNVEYKEREKRSLDVENV